MSKRSPESRVQSREQKGFDGARPIWLHIILLAALLTLAAHSAAAAGDVLVPRLIGRDAASAKQALTDTQLVPQFQMGMPAPQGAEPLRVYAQEPQADQRVPAGSTVLVKVYSQSAPPPAGAPALAPSEGVRLREVHFLRAHGDSAFGATVTPDGSQVVSVGVDGAARVWSLPGGTETASWQAHDGWAVGVAMLGPDRVVTCGNDMAVRIWNLAGRTQLHQLAGHTDKVWSVAASADGQTMLSGSHDKSARLWSAAGQELRRLEGHSGAVWGVGLSADGRRAVSSDMDGTVWAWDTASGKPLYQLKGHTKGTVAVTLSSDGLRALSGSGDNTMRLWDLQTGNELRRFEGHTLAVRAVAFSPDGRRAATASYDQTIRLWSLDSSQELARFDWIAPPGATKLLFDVEFTPNGQHIVAAGGGGVRVLEIASEP